MNQTPAATLAAALAGMPDVIPSRYPLLVSPNQYAWIQKAYGISPKAMPPKTFHPAIRKLLGLSNPIERTVLT